MRALAFETAVDRVIKAPRQEAAFIYFWTTSYSLPKSSGLRLFSTVKTLSISCPFDLEVFSSCSYFLLKSRIVFSFSFGKSVLNIFTQAAAPVSLANFVILNLSSFAYLMYFPRVPLASPILFSVAKLLTEPRAEREAAVRFIYKQGLITHFIDYKVFPASKSSKNLQNLWDCLLNQFICSFIAFIKCLNKNHHRTSSSYSWIPLLS